MRKMKYDVSWLPLDFVEHYITMRALITPLNVLIFYGVMLLIFTPFIKTGVFIVVVSHSVKQYVNAYCLGASDLILTILKKVGQA